MQRKLLKTALFSVEHRTYSSPGQETIARDVVVHPGAVVILPILDDHRIVMIRNYRYTIERELWELPAGTIEPEEEPITTARRELEEESGYRADRIRPLMEFYTSPGILTERMHAFVATGLTLVGQKLQAGERIMAKPVDADVVREKLFNGELADGKTIAVLARYFLGLGE